MIGMMMMTFILFFAFVVNTGMLVNAKINLQNATDLAAYAGAAVQARTLNQISYLNYEMRRQYKKFLFRYYVMGNMSQDPFPRAPGGGKTVPEWGPTAGIGYGAPTVCMIFNASDNFCHLNKLPKITIPTGNKLDTINETLISQLKAIEAIRKDNCLKIGFTNTAVMRLWLWNTDPNLDKIQEALTPELQRSVNTIRGLAFGLGLIPRELILRERIRTLNDYVNQAPAKGVKLDTLGALQGGQDPATHERTIQAFLSAYYTLGNHAFPSDEIVMDELTPSTLLKLNDIKARFDAYAIDFRLDDPSADSSDCSPFVTVDTLRKDAVFGVAKDREVLTYYAVRLKAKAKIMFSPFGDVELKAYAAAQPFGSRIGPELTEGDFTHEAELDGRIQPDGMATSLTVAKKVPNLPIREEGDSAARGNGWDTKDALGAFYAKFQGQGATGGNGAIKTIGTSELNRAYQAAMVPNPWEANRYNIINDLGNDPFVRNFDTAQVHAFWAPVVSPSKASEANARLQAAVDDLIGDTGKDPAEFKQALKNQLSQYLEKLRKGQGEPIGGTAEGFNIARIRDPFNTLPEDGPIQPITIAGGISENRPEKIKSSWNGVLNGKFQQEGRVGYSVKFISFEALRGKKLKTDDAHVWTNDLGADAEAQADLEFVKH